MTNELKIAAFCLAAALVAPAAALAQTTHSITVYGVGFQIDGTASVGDLTTTIDVDVDEFIDDLEMGGLAGYRLQTPRWSLVVDAAFMGLGQSQNGRSMDVDMTVAEVDAGYRFSQVAEAFLGVRYTDLSAEVASTMPISGEPVDATSSDDFVDPVVGLRFAAPLAESWLVQGQGDVGGFGVGMDLEWQAKLELGYRPSETWTIWLGYRALNQDFDDAGDMELFAMDATYQGPELGVTFSF